MGLPYGKDFGPFADLADKLGTSPPNFLDEGDVVVDRERLDVDVHGLQHDHLLCRAARDPAELYEAAAVDGAGAVRTAIHIKLPLLRPAILLCTIFCVIGSFQLFAEPRVFYDLAPQVIGKSYTPNLYVYNLAFADQRLNYAAALSFLLGAIVFVVSFVVMRISSRQEARS